MAAELGVLTDQKWGSTDPLLISDEVWYEIYGEGDIPQDIITTWGQRLPNPVWAWRDLDLLLQLCQTPNLRYPQPPVPERVLRRVNINSTFGCWELPRYEDQKNRARYPLITSVVHEAIGEGAHRFMWRQLVGPIPPDTVLDHRCLNKKCCWPRHLELVTGVENTRRGRLDTRHKTQPHFWQPEPTILTEVSSASQLIDGSDTS